MKKLGLLGAMLETRKYSRLNTVQRLALRERRLRDLVDYARTNSPYYRRLYSGLALGCEFTSLPPVNKAELMDNFDDWVTDSAIHLEDIRTFMEDRENVGKKIFG